MEEDKKWTNLPSPPPPMFVGKKERDLTKQINDEVLERITGQQIAYYAISLEHTNYHPLYGEAINKTFLHPVHVYALIEWNGYETTTDEFGIDRKAAITIHFHKRRLTEDQDLYVREGDFVQYGSDYYEIISLNEPREMFGQTAHKVEISADCIKTRKGIFNAS